MDIISIVADVIVVGSVILTSFGFKKYIHDYMGQKGKNVATKEDIKEITQKTEEVKDEFKKRLLLLSEDIHLQKYKEQQVYEQKFKAIKDSLQFIDTYISWLTIDDGSKKPVREKVTVSEMTMRFRENYNSLAMTCDDKMILELFIDIVFGEGGNTFEQYNQYRNVARKELGVSNAIEFDRDRVFFSIIGTHDLHNANN